MKTDGIEGEGNRGHSFWGGCESKYEMGEDARQGEWLRDSWRVMNKCDSQSVSVAMNYSPLIEVGELENCL